MVRFIFEVILGFLAFVGFAVLLVWKYEGIVRINREFDKPVE